MVILLATKLSSVVFLPELTLLEFPLSLKSKHSSRPFALILNVELAKSPQQYLTHVLDYLEISFIRLISPLLLLSVFYKIPREKQIQTHSRE